MGAIDGENDDEAAGSRGSSGGGQERRLRLAPTAASSGQILATNGAMWMGKCSGRISGERGV